MSEETMMLGRWDELPSDLLFEVVKHFDSSKDYVMFRATCKSWNLNLPKTPSHIRGPQLMLPFNYEFDIKVDKDFFHSRLPCMPPRTLFRGSGFGWVISIGTDGVIRMFNPLIKAHFDLPPMSTTPEIVAYDPEKKLYTFTTSSDDDIIIHCSHLRVQIRHLQKIIISSYPSPPDEDFMAITIYGEEHKLAFCKFGDKKWTEFSGWDNYFLQDAIFYEGKIYGIDCNARLVEFDVKTSIATTVEVPRPNDDPRIHLYDVNIKYLIRSVEGDLLMAVRHWEIVEKVGVDGNKESSYKTKIFNLYKLDKNMKQWTRMFSLGNSVLVVGYNGSTSMLPFGDGKGNWVRNCIYFTDNNFEDQSTDIIGGHDVGVFNLQDGTIHHFFPESDFIFPPPIWLFPQNFIS